MTPSTTFESWAAEQRQILESFLEQHLPPETQMPTDLHHAMRYATLDGGKRLRALLTLTTAELLDAPQGAALWAAGSIELIHAYSLIHDDLPCMDNDTLRRGKPTCHVRFGEATALLAGDALQSLAFQWLTESAHPDEAARHLAQVSLLAVASGSRGMAGGQAMDLTSQQATLSLNELEIMHLKKTGALIRAAVLLGTHCGGQDASEEARHTLTRFANRLGLLYQIVDDVLDHTADTATLGKTAGKDAAHHKATYVTLLGLAQAQAKADEVLSDALNTLTQLPDPSTRLRDLALHISQRCH